MYDLVLDALQHVWWSVVVSGGTLETDVAMYLAVYLALVLALATGVRLTRVTI